MSIISYLIISPLHHLQPHLFQEKGTGASRVVSHLPKEMRCNGDAMLQHPHWCNARHVICLRCATDERKGPGLVESDENALLGDSSRQIPTNRAVAFARPVSFLTSCKQKISTVGNETSSTKCLKPCKSGFLMVSYGFPKKNDALCVTCWFGRFLLRHIHFSKHNTKATPMASSKAGCTLSTC